jgi:subfamily B ATP-binding cassette protein MsbA
MSDKYSQKDLYNVVGRRIIKEIVFPQWRKILGTIILMIIIASTNSWQAFLIQPAIDKTLFNPEKGADRDYLLFYLPMLIIGVTVIKGVATYFQQVMSANLMLRMTNEVRSRMYDKFIRADLKTFNQRSSGEMLSNLVNDIAGMMGAINTILSGVFKNFFSVIFLVGVMFYMNWVLALIAFVGVPFTIIPIYLVYKQLGKYMNSNQTMLQSYMVQIEDTLRSVRVVKAYHAEDYESDRLKQTLKGMYNLSKKIQRMSNIPSPLNETLIGVGIASVLAYGGNLVATGQSTPGAFFAFFTAMMMAYRPMKSVAGLNTQLYMALICGSRVFDILDLEPTIKEKPDAITLEQAKGAIKFENVNFEYNEGKNVLQNINLEVESGKTYALVGHSGGGKSTIMNLILRFYDPSQGVITLDGHDLRDLKMHSLRNATSYVGQEIQLFDDTIYENIRYGKMNATEEEVIEAAKKAEAHDFIIAAENSYQTKIGQNGLKLSGGQRQRISIARAILKNSPVLLLDEATSALDPISEKLVQQALTKLMKGRTTLVIAHRLSTVMQSDKIFVISNGKITESGTHAELLAQNGEYANLYSKQFESNDVAE